MAQPEKKLLWHPTRSNRFIVGGGNPGQIKVYDWDGKSDITEVTALGDLQHMKCFALSPHCLDDDLIAVGNSLGKVELMRFSIPHPPNAIRSPSVVTLPVRTSRTCNTLAFSYLDPNYLAVGLDKVRGDPSLVIWDIETVSSGLSTSSAPHQGAFSRPQPLLPRSVRGDKSTIQQWAHAEVVTSLAFLPNTTSLLVAGVSHRWLRLFDLRNSSSPTNPLTTATKSVHGISVDPFDPNRIACFGEDGAVRVWDYRWFGSPILTFTERDAVADGANPRGTTAISGIEFSNSRRGTIATIQKDAVQVRFWDTVKATFPEECGMPAIRPDGAHEEIHASKISKLARLPWSSPAAEPQPNPQSSNHAATRGEQLILHNTRTSTRFTRLVSSFAFIPGDPSHANEYSIAVVTKDGDLDMQTMHDPPQPQWSSRGELSITRGRSYMVYQPFRDEEPIAEPWTVVPQEQPLLRTGVPSPHHPGRGSNDLPTLGDTPEDPLSSVTRHIRTYSPASMGRFPLDRSPAPDATPRPGKFTLRPETDTAEKRGRTYYKPELKTFSRSLSRGKLSSNERATRRIIMDDISMVIRRRVLQGYGLDNVIHNAGIVRSDPSHGEVLSELWLWIENSKHLLSYGGSRIHGFDFANQGVLGIWEGFQPVSRTTSSERDLGIGHPMGRNVQPSLLALPDSEGYGTVGRHRRKRSLRRSHSPADQLHGDFVAAVHTLNNRRGYDRASVTKISAPTSKLAQRRFCLTLCGWNQGDDELLRATGRWEKEGQLTKAACWLLFTDHHDKAIECLMRSDDERLRIMSGTIAALISQRGTSAQLREHYNRLIVRLEDKYLRVMLTHIALEDWSEILQEESLPLKERLAVAFRFLDDRALSSYLRQLADRFRAHGDIEGLVLTGLTPMGIDVLQAYVDSTGDVQTASILAALVCPGTFQDSRAERWLEAYRSLLDSWRLFHHRCQFDIERGKLIKEAVAREDVLPFDWVPPQLVVRCGFCNKAINARAPMVGPGPGGRIRVNCCQSCGRSLPRCAICLMTLGLAFDSARNAELAEGLEPKDTIDDAIVFCQTCKHGGHVSHMLNWFYGGDAQGECEGRSHDECPVAGCDCRCALR